jgi:hypothetical protein
VKYAKGQTLYTMRSNALATLCVIGMQHTDTPAGVSDTYLCRDDSDGLVRWYPEAELHANKQDLFGALGA